MTTHTDRWCRIADCLPDDGQLLVIHCPKKDPDIYFAEYRAGELMFAYNGILFEISDVDEWQAIHPTVVNVLREQLFEIARLRHRILHESKY